MSIRKSKTGQPVQASTIKQYISLIKGHYSFKYAFDLVGDPQQLTRITKQLIQKDPRSHQKRKRRGLRGRHLRTLWEEHPSVSKDDLNTINLWAAATSSWQLLARGGELCAKDMTRADLSFGGKASGRWACIKLRPLKKKGITPEPKIPQYILKHDGQGSDTYEALVRLDTLDPVRQERKSQTPLFRTGITKRRRMTVDRFKKWIQHLGKNLLGLGSTEEWGAHSGRIGGATDLTGKDPALLKAKGRWGSDIAFIYARMTKRSQLKASKQMQSAKGRDIEELYPEFTQN